MEVMRRLHAVLAEHAAGVTVDAFTVGLGYTAVATSDAGLGLAYTWFEDKACCSYMRGWGAAEGLPASVLLDRLLSDDAFERSVGVATANALNHAFAAALPSDRSSAGALVDVLAIGQGSRVAMVGFFPPVARALEELGAELSVIDEGLGMGDRRTFEQQLGGRAEVLVMSGTTVLNGTTEDLLGHAGPEIRVALLGPTTPLVPEAFGHLPVRVLAGMVPRDAAAVLRAVRHGGGTPELQKFSRKDFCLCEPQTAGKVAP